MPKTARYTLTWTPLRQGYELQESQDGGGRDIVSESSAWFEWVSQVSSFAFHGRDGSYTAVKERKQRGGEYWYAYARVAGKMSKRYIGRDVGLTFSRLEEVAQELWLERPASQLSRGSNTPVRKAKTANPLLSVDPLLATKLYVPRPRVHLVHRSRLTQRLQQVRECALTLLSAPVGFGKSTLLADWLASCNITASWLSLEAEDNKPTRFLTYLLAALQTGNPDLDTTGHLLHGPLHPLSMEGILTLIINDLLVRRASIEEHIVLVLDNYQVITDGAIHQAVAFLLDHLPPQMHLVIATREDPPLPLAHLRGRDDLLELRARDLRFTEEEASTFLLDVMELPLSREESAILHARTEGWITGLQLVAFSLQGRNNPQEFITAFSGSHHYVVDYLLEEVLNRQSEAIQGFLLQTSILERLNVPLCDTVREQDGSRELLDFLERTNLFLIPLDDERKWYRYHRLFAEALRQRLQQTAPELLPELHLRASRWYEQHGLFTEAVSHALVAPVPPPHLLFELLTAREREVLRLLLDGASNREIAYHLVVSMNTVKKHVLNICRKLNVRSRVQIITQARMLHLL